MAGFATVGIRLAAIGTSAFASSVGASARVSNQLGAAFRVSAEAAVDATAAIAAVTAGLNSLVLVGTTLSSIRFAATIEQDFKFIQAVLQATDSEMRQLLSTTEQIASNAPIAFRQVGDQIRELGRAGIDLDRISGSAARLTASLGILARGEASPQKIAEALASGEQAFKATGGTLDEVAKSILGVANATRLSIPEVISAFSKAAPTAGLFKATADELGAFIAVVGAAGIRGEEAGTGIRNFLLRLSNPSKEAAQQMVKFGISAFDAAGNTRPLVDILGNLQAVYSDSAIQARGVTEAQRAYSLSQIFQTRTAAVAALAIIQGTEAYNKYLAVIRETDPILQAQVATDNLLDRIEILKNRVQILSNVFGSGALAGLNRFAESIQNALGDVSDPTNRFRQAAGAAGQGVGALFSGTGIGEAADQIEAQFGRSVANTFQTIAIEAARVRDIIAGQLVPAVIEFVNALGRLAVGTVFNPSAAITFGDVVRQITGFFIGTIQAATILTETIRAMAPIAAAVGQVIGTIFSAIGATVKSQLTVLAAAAVDAANTATALDQAARRFQARGLPGDQQIADTISNLANVFGAIAQIRTGLATTGEQIADVFDTANTSIGQVSANLQQMQQREQQIRALANAIRVLEEQLKTLESEQLAPEGPDRTAEIASTRLSIAAAREEIQTLSGVSGADDAVAAARERVRQATEEWNAAQQKLTASFRDFGAEEREAARQAEAMETAVRRLVDVYADLERQVEKTNREIVDKISDLVDKTNTALAKVETDRLSRIDDIREKLAEANADAQEAFDFETTVGRQRLVFTQLFEDAGTAQDRFFDKTRRLQQDDIQARERSRQREQGLIEQSLQREVDARTRANSEINEDFARGVSERFQDLTRAINRSQQAEIEALSETFRSQNERRSRTDEDTRRQRDLNRELARAKTEDDRRSIRERFEEQSRDLRDTRQIQDRDNRIQQQQQKQLQQVRQQQEESNIILQRNIAKQELAIRRALAQQERDFRLQQEIGLFAVRVRLEEAFIAETIRLREGTDVPQAERLQDRQTGANRALQQAQQIVTDAFRQQEFDRNTVQRERQAGRQERDANRDAIKREGELLTEFYETLARLNRDGEQRLLDLLNGALNTADEIQRRIGTNFPALDTFRSRANALVQGAQANRETAVANAPAGLQQQVGIGASAGFLLVAATNVEATQQMKLLTTELNALRLVVQERRQVGGVNLEVDDINIRNSVIIGDSGIPRLGSLVGGSLAEVIRQK